MKHHEHQIVIVGGGSAGITVAARLRRADKSLDVAMIEPSEKHYYQPLWTMVGGGIVDKEKTERDEADFVPAGVEWIHDSVVGFDPQADSLTLKSGSRVSYEWLIVAPGIQINWDQVKGLREAIGSDGVCSNYDYRYADSTWEAFQRLESGNAVFTYPSTPIKCGGAPQKIMWLCDDYLRRNDRREQTNVIFASAGERIFGIEKYRAALEKLVLDRDIETRWDHDLVEVRAASREAVFRRAESGEEVVIEYGLLHAVPPMSAPDVVADSPLAGEGGWVDVDKYNLQHNRFANVFSLGDASSLPTSKTGAAVRKQAPVLVANLRAAIAGDNMTAKYNGYTSCPLITGYGKLILAEFDYDGNPAETFPFDQSKERWSMYQLKRYVLPPLYWRGMLRGRA